MHKSQRKINRSQPLGMKDVQKIAFKILVDFADFCEKENLQYFLAYGTLIGALRHKGFIPWDDDIDVIMPRADYEKFLRICKSNGNKFGKYKIFNPRTLRKYPYGITRICDTDYIIEKEIKGENCGMGIFIDLYPFDGLGNDKEEAAGIMSKSRHWSFRISEILNFDSSSLANMKLGKRVRTFLKFGFKRLVSHRDYLRKLEHQGKLHDYEVSKFVGCANWCFAPDGTQAYFDKEMFKSAVKVPFEGKMFNAPVGYDAFLTQIYGDYMTPPPPEQRVYHHEYKAYKR